MTYTFKKDLRRTWDLPPVSEDPVDLMGNDDEQDIYISERSSIVSSNDFNETITPIEKRLPTPTSSTLLSIPQFSRHSQNEFLDNHTSLITQNQQRYKEEIKIKKNDLRKIQPVHVNVSSVHENKSPEYTENYYPSWNYYKSQNPSWITRQRPNISHEISDHSQQHNYQAAFTSSSIKLKQPPVRKTRQSNGSIAHPNQDKQRLEYFDNSSSISIHSITHDNHLKQRTSLKHNLIQKDFDHDEHRILPTKKPVRQQRRKAKNDHDLTDNHGQTISNNRSYQDSNALMITSNSVINRQKNQSKFSDKTSLITDLDEPNKSRYYQNYIRTHNSPSIPTHHHNHLYIRRRPPSGSEVHVVDVAFKRSDRTSFNQQIRDQFHSPLSPTSNQTLHLPLIINDHHHHHQPKNHSPRFPTEYYGTLARQPHGKNWDESLDVPKIYKPDVQTRFYDRYLHNVVDKRLAA